MRKPLINNAYIDGANLHNALKALSWQLDYKRFRVWLAEKHGIKQAFLFLGFLSKHNDRYAYLQECGFILVFKEVTYIQSGKVKGNCDADLILAATRDVLENEFEKALIVSSDGDFASLVHFLQQKKRLLGILSPNKGERCSILLKRTNARITYLNDQQNALKLNKKAPDADGIA